MIRASQGGPHEKSHQESRSQNDEDREKSSSQDSEVIAFGVRAGA
jgi:hypothetical protein